MSLLTTVVGYTTSSTSQILAIFKPSNATTARIAYQDSSGVQHAVDVALTPVAPYALAKFSLKNLSLPSVKYAVADWTQNAPDPAAMLASPAARFFRLGSQVGLNRRSRATGPRATRDPRPPGCSWRLRRRRSSCQCSPRR